MATKKATKAAGTLDLDFGDDGTVFFTLSQGVFGGSTKLLSDGKLLTAGADGNDVVLVRHTSDGALDESFGNRGVKRINLIPGGRVAQAGSFVQSNGLVLVWGSLGERYEEVLFLFRIQPDGKLDTDFGREGRVFIDLPTGQDIAGTLAVQSDGKIVLSARSVRGFEDWDEVLLRLDSEGHLDPNFGKAGMMFFGGNHYFSSLIALPDHRLLLAGSKDGDPMFARFSSNGRLDSDFGDDGFVKVKIENSEFAEFSGAKRQRDGKIVAVGSAYIESKGFQTLAARINPDGSPDDTFNKGAPALISFQGYNAQHYAVAIQSDNKILAAGSSLGTVDTSMFTLMRFLPNGALDMEFGSQGRVMTDLGGLDVSQNVVVQSDGKIVVSGTVLVSPKGSGLGIARYLG